MIPVSIPSPASLPPVWLAVPPVAGPVEGALPFTMPDAPIAPSPEDADTETGAQEAVMASAVPVEQILPLVVHLSGLAAAQEVAVKEPAAPLPTAPFPVSSGAAAVLRPNLRSRAVDTPRARAPLNPEPAASGVMEEAEIPALHESSGQPAPVAKTETPPSQIARGAGEAQQWGTATPQRFAEDAASTDRNPVAEAVSREPIESMPEITSAPAAKPAGQAIPMITVAFDLSASAARPIDPAPVATPAAPIAEHQLDLAHEELWLGQLARDIAAMGEGRGVASFRLLPRALGQLDVNIQPSDNGLAIHMSASSEDARAIVAAAQPKLVEEIRAQGVRVADASVGNGSMGDPKGGRAPEYRPPFIEVALNTSDPAPQRSEARARAGRYA